MIYVALAEAVVLALAVATFARVLHWMLREHSRERHLLVNKVMYLADRPWEAPPGQTEPEPEPEPEPDWDDAAFDVAYP